MSQSHKLVYMIFYWGIIFFLRNKIGTKAIVYSVYMAEIQFTSDNLQDSVLPFYCINEVFMNDLPVFFGLVLLLKSHIGIKKNWFEVGIQTTFICL